jgi:hypothetical protein
MSSLFDLEVEYGRMTLNDNLGGVTEEAFSSSSLNVFGGGIKLLHSLIWTSAIACFFLVLKIFKNHCVQKRSYF